MKPRSALIAGTLAVAVALCCVMYSQKKIDGVRKSGEAANLALSDRVKELENARTTAETEVRETSFTFGAMTNDLREEIIDLDNGNKKLEDENKDLRAELEKLRQDFVEYQNRITKIYAEAGYLTHLVVESFDTKEPTKKRQGCLSGSVIEYPENSGNFYILTAAHLESPGYTTSKITVTFDFGKSAQEAEILGYDRNYDVMLLKFKDPKFKYAGKTPRLAKPDDVKVGQRVVAMGSPLWKPFVLSVGYISKRFPDRPATRELLMHCALTNPGNSGGPLLNDEGELVGITTAAYVDPIRNEVTPMPLAVSIKSILQVLPELVRGQKN